MFKHSITFRHITPKDKTFVHRVHDEAYHDVIVRQFGAWDQKVEDTFFEQIWSHPGLQIIECDNRDCGFFCVDSLPDQLFIFETVLLPEFQGQGIGTLLVSRMQQRAINEHKALTLEVLKANERAKTLYERLGFVVNGKNETHYKMRWDSRSI